MTPARPLEAARAAAARAEAGHPLVARAHAFAYRRRRSLACFAIPVAGVLTIPGLYVEQEWLPVALGTGLSATYVWDGVAAWRQGR